jgi:FAD/FMN-containing dehydrogenase/Fe-S oxidoreductase
MTVVHNVDFEPLARSISGDVHWDLLWRYMLATDGSIFQRLPACVVYPKSAQDVVETVGFAAKAGLSVHARGAGSGLTGAAIGQGVVLDFTRYMNRLLVLDEERKRFVCEPGYRLGELEARLKGTGLFFPPDPSSGEYATFGGMFGTNASGAHSVKYGNVADYVLDADVVTASGETLTLSKVKNIAIENLPENLKKLHGMYTGLADDVESAYPSVQCNVAGYNLKGLVREGRLCLDRLFVGAEGTLGIATRLTFRLLPKPAHDSLVVAFFDDPLNAARATQAILPLSPAGIEIMDKSLLRLAKESEPALRGRIPDGIDNAVLIEFDANDPDTCTHSADMALRIIREKNFSNQAYSAVSGEEKERFWAVRKAAVPILYKLKGRKKILALIEDAAVPTDRMVEYFNGIYRILGGLGVDFVLYGHIAKGLMHTRPLLDLKDPHDVALLRTIADKVFELVASLEGTVSGEHGDGRLRSAYLRRRYPKIYDLFLETKRLLDPGGILNPEIITHHDPDQMMKHLRFGEEYPADAGQTTQLLWRAEGFAVETEKCHGCSKCTTVTAATRMCPVYKATREETASPKAKANLLRALICGAMDDRTLYEKAFQEVMALCANCGSCAFECPSHVDIPKLAMEARSRYVARFGTSFHNRLVTRVEAAGRTLRKISPALRVVRNLPGVAGMAERVSGVAREREVLGLSSTSLFERVQAREGEGDLTVLYFAGCYAGYLQPRIGEAALMALTRMGAAVLTPPQHCCGLPAMTKGMIGDARTVVLKNLEKWGHLLDRVDHVVVTCSSCGHALMKDWGDLVHDQRAVLAAEKLIHISRFLDNHWDRLDLEPHSEHIAYHQPCHLKIQSDPDSSLRMLSRIPGVRVEDLKAHCCGMMGSWGMAAANYPLSRRIGEDLIHKMDASDALFAVTDCPTCRMQMEAFGNKPVMHPVEVVVARLREGMPGRKSWRKNDY